ncbi:MAG: methyltransferase [Flavobacteriaceae bacterium]|nr:MAG: methyltransferase [Flavobacteriaceae bacterium]
MKVGTDGVLLGAWCSIDHSPKTILDIGSGTGVITLMLAQRCSNAIVNAVEIDKKAYQQSVENFKRSNWSHRLFCYHSAFQDFTQKMVKEAYDLIISNPPFYSDAYETKDTARNKARFTSSLSFRELITRATNLLSATGKFAVILPYKEEQRFIASALENKLFPNKVCSVKGTPYSRTKRSLLEFSFGKKEIIEEQLIIETARHQYTQKYMELTKGFYLKL